MPGFCIEKHIEGASHTSELKLVDAGGCPVTGSFRVGSTAAVWAHLGDAAQWRAYERPGRLLVVEGEPDRFPGEDEDLEDWLPGRWGSFRGFEITDVRVRVFVDPLGTRPVYYLKNAGRFYVADRLPTLAVNLEDGQVCWPVVLEQMMLNAVYSRGATLEGAIALQPGETLDLSGDAASCGERRRLPEDRDLTAERVRRDPGAALLAAMEKAVQETWTREDSWLLLSGGLDSRLTLALAGPGRKTLNVTTAENTESRAARQIAERCGAEFRHWQRPPEHYHGVVRDSVFLTGAMWDSNVAHHLGLGREWRREGITAVAHAFLYDTVLKGWFTFPDQAYPPINLRVYEAVGELESCFQKRSGRASESAPDDVLDLLSQEGREIALEQLRRLAREMPLVREDGFNVTIERRLIESISRQCHYGGLVAWMEELSVSSPIFHPALWSWYAHSRPSDRYRGKAIRSALRLLGHPVLQVIDSNTGAPVSFRKDWRESLRRQPPYRLLRRLAHLLRKPGARTPLRIAARDEGSWPPLPPLLRSTRGPEILEEGIGYLEGCPLFSGAALREALAHFLGGDDRPMEPLMAAMTAGRWLRLVSQGRDCAAPQVRTIPISAATAS
jgi:Asparagine synthase